MVSMILSSQGSLWVNQHVFPAPLMFKGKTRQKGMCRSGAGHPIFTFKTVGGRMGVRKCLYASLCIQMRLWSLHYQQRNRKLFSSPSWLLGCRISLWVAEAPSFTTWHSWEQNGPMQCSRKSCELRDKQGTTWNATVLQGSWAATSSSGAHTLWDNL